MRLSEALIVIVLIALMGLAFYAPKLARKSRQKAREEERREFEEAGLGDQPTPAEADQTGPTPVILAEPETEAP
jgi:hypothetical protein